MRYYLPAAPLTLAATAAALVDSWRAGGDRRAILTAAAGTVSATAITGYLVRNVNRRLLQSPEPLRASESRGLVSRWHRTTCCGCWHSPSPPWRCGAASTAHR